MLGKSISYLQYEKFTYMAKITIENYRICEDGRKNGQSFALLVEGRIDTMLLEDDLAIDAFNFGSAATRNLS